MALVQPIFLLALVFESRSPFMPRPGEGRPFVETWLLLAMMATEVMAVVGVENDGLHGAVAQIAWVLFTTTLVIVTAAILVQMWRGPRGPELE